MENEGVGKRVIEFFREVKKNYRRKKGAMVHVKSIWVCYLALIKIRVLPSHRNWEMGPLLAGTRGDFFWQYWAFLGRYFGGTSVIPGMRPWAVRNYTSVYSSPIGQGWNRIEQRTQGNLTGTESMRNVCAREKCAWEVSQDSTSETTRVRH